MIFPDVEFKGRGEEAQPLSVYADWAIDFEAGQMALKNGRPYIVEGAEALKVWIWKALKTRKNAFAAYSGGFGQEHHALIGMMDYEAVRLKLKRCIRECLGANPYIKGADGFEFERDGAAITVRFTARTLYGDVGGESFISY